ncbi:hypothetical protein D1872_286010 [compost metagenome]
MEIVNQGLQEAGSDGNPCILCSARELDGQRLFAGCRQNDSGNGNSECACRKRSRADVFRRS